PSQPEQAKTLGFSPTSSRGGKSVHHAASSTVQGAGPRLQLSAMTDPIRSEGGRESYRCRRTSSWLRGSEGVWEPPSVGFESGPRLDRQKARLNCLPSTGSHRGRRGAVDHASTVVPDERRTDGAGRGRQRSPSHRGGILRDAPADARREESQSCVARAG